MFNEVFKSVGGIDNYGLLSTIIFMVFFILVLVYTVSLKAGDVSKFSNMPLDDEEKGSQDI